MYVIKGIIPIMGGQLPPRIIRTKLATQAHKLHLTDGAVPVPGECRQEHGQKEL